MRKTAILAILTLALATSAACGDERVVAVGGGPVGDATSQTDVPTDPDGNPIIPTGDGREIIALHDTSTPLQVLVTQNQALSVKVIDYARSGPAADVAVNFAITAGDDAGDATLTSLQTYTNDNGVAGVTFRANTVANARYTVTVSTSGADPVAFDVLVTDSPRGDIEVALEYEGPIAVRNVHLRLVPGDFTCGQFSPVYPPVDVLADKTLLGVGQGAVRFESLAAGQRFTVFATAESQAGGLAAAGCLDGVVVIGEQTNTVTLTMHLLVLNPTGVYDSESIFDFTGAIPGRVGELITEMSLLFTSPGQFLINRVKDLAAIYVGEFITDAVFGLFEDAVADVIDDWMFNNSPSWVRDILTVGQDLFQVVNRLEMLADLQISKLQSDYYVTGRLLWNGIALRWRYGCPAEGSAGFDPECGRYVFDLGDFSNTQFPMDIIEGRFTASVQDFDQLDIDNHTIKINYGKLVIFVLNELILPALTGEHTLLDAVLSFVDCRAIAESIGGFSAIGISVDDVEGFCVSGVSLVVSPITLILGNLAIDSQLRLSGHATLVDHNDDLWVDEVVDGSFLGHVESDGQQGPPFTGVWEAVKKQQ